MANINYKKAILIFYVFVIISLNTILVFGLQGFGFDNQKVPYLKSEDKLITYIFNDTNIYNDTLWNRTGTTLTPATSGSSLSVSGLTFDATTTHLNITTSAAGGQVALNCPFGYYLKMVCDLWGNAAIITNKGTLSWPLNMAHTASYPSCWYDETTVHAACRDNTGTWLRDDMQSGAGYMLVNGSRYVIVANLAGNVIIGNGYQPRGKLQIGNELYASDVVTNYSSVLIVGNTSQSQTSEPILRLMREVNLSNYYPSTMDINMKAYNAGGAGDGYIPHTQVDFKLKSIGSFTLDADRTVLSLKDNGEVLIPDGKIAIGGTSTPLGQLHLVDIGASSVNRGIFNDEYVSSASAPLMVFRKARGTQTSPSIVSNGDYTGAFSYQAYNGSTFLDTAGFGSFVDGTVTASSIPQTLLFYTTGGTHTTNPATGGFIRMVINPNGNVGIGTTNPNATLHITKTNLNIPTSGYNPIQFIDVGTNYYATEYKGNGLYTGFLISNNQSSYMGVPYIQFLNIPYNKLWTMQLEYSKAFAIREGNAAGTSRFTIIEGGNVGIGTTTPIAYLDIGRNASNALKVGGYLNVVSNAGSWVTHNAYWNTTAWTRIENGDNKPAGFYFQNGLIQFVYATSTTGSPTFLNSMTIDNSGNVGIGTTTPAYKLDVSRASATAYSTDMTLATLVANSGMRVINTQNTVGTSALIISQAIGGDSNSNIWYYGLGSSSAGVDGGNFVIGKRDGADSTTEYMRINNLGNVGIGTTTPSEKLTVIGGINQTSGNSTINMIYGEMYANNAVITIDILSADVYYPVNTSLSSGLMNGFTFNINKSMTAQNTGIYKIDWHMSAKTASVANKEVEGTVMINSVAQNKSTSHAEVSPGGSNRPETISGSGLFNLNSGDIVGLGISNHIDTTDVVVEHLSITALRVGN